MGFLKKKITIFCVSLSLIFANSLLFAEEEEIMLQSISDQIQVLTKDLKVLEKAVYKKSHRWKYAYAKKSYKELSNQNYIESIDHRLYALGDWCQGPSMQDAWLAGKKLAKHFSELRLQI